MSSPQNPRYLIIRASNTPQLAAEVDPKLADGVWRCAGAPFYDKDRLEWCQAIERSEKLRPEMRTAPGEVKLREPRKP